MATTTTNFSWPIPQSSDLVKDGATAIASLGSGIDTSMAELKGGTTGQVLSKASNTDMDFSWVTSDDANAIQNAIVDAKGDLIAATANDTPARLAVGSDYAILSALSSETTGLKWQGKVTSYTPTWGSTGTAPSLGNGVATGRYIRIGDLVFFYVNITMGSTTTYGSGTYTFTLPIATSISGYGISGYGMALDNGVAWYRGLFPELVVNGYTDKFNLASTVGNTVQPTVPFTFGNTDQILAWGSYLVA